MQKRIPTLLGIVIILVAVFFCLGGVFVYQYYATPKNNILVPYPEAINFVRPRSNIKKDAPAEAGFNTFSIVIPGVFSRSGQPTLSEFQWLKNNGWKGIVDLRQPDEYNEIADDKNIKGFSNLRFNYLSLKIKDGFAPTDQ
jgi:hypothetical protein